MAHTAIPTNEPYMVMFKLPGDAIHLWSAQEKQMQPMSKEHSFKILCRNVEGTYSNNLDMKTLFFSDPGTDSENCTLEHQQTSGRPISSSDVAMFMTSPVPSSSKVSYAFDLEVSSKDLGVLKGNEDCDKRIGTAYLYLDPKFSSQGIQRTPIIASGTNLPMGQMQIEYLIITNPVAYGQSAPKPEWMSKLNQFHAGHRGSGSGCRMDLPEKLLENTIASFNYAHRNGADICELDVQVSADGVPVIYHDFDVDAKQSSDELGKVQVGELTVNQLRDLQFLSVHDGGGCTYTLNVPNQDESNRPFPTLAEVLNQVDGSCGLNIEIKWPQMLESGRMEARKCREINDFVDKIINVVDANARNRRIVLESFDPDVVAMLRFKQNRFPVVLIHKGLLDPQKRYMDIRARHPINGVYYAQALDLAGIDLIMGYYMLSGKKLVDFITSHNLVARTWGNIGDKAEKLDFLKEIGLQCITYDKIDLIMTDQVRSNMLA